METVTPKLLELATHHPYSLAELSSLKGHFNLRDKEVEDCIIMARQTGQSLGDMGQKLRRRRFRLCYRMDRLVWFEKTTFGWEWFFAGYSNMIHNREPYLDNESYFNRFNRKK